MKWYCHILIVCCLVSSLKAQQIPLIGITDQRPTTFAFKNATIFIDYKTKLDNATLLIKDGLVVDVGINIPIPDGASVLDLKGKYIYPSFIDIYTNYGIELKEHGVENPFITASELSSIPQGVNWNEAIKSNYNSCDEFKVDKKNSEAFRKQGFGTVLSFRPDGIFRGTSLLAALVDESANKAIIKPKVASNLSFNKGTSKQTYPSSLMGSIALIRQTYYDAEWYNNQKKKPYTDACLEAINENKNLPQLFEVDDKLSILRAKKISDEFNIQYIIKGKGDDYQLADAIKQANIPLIVSINFPPAPKISNQYEAERVSLKTMRHWEAAPASLALLEQKGIQFAITSSNLEDINDFFKNLQKAISNGLSEEGALKGLTYNPARFLKIESMIGSLKKGMIANFIITSDNLFRKGCTIHENWVRGIKYSINRYDLPDYSGFYKLVIEKDTFSLKIAGTISKPEFFFKKDTIQTPITGSIIDGIITLSFKKSKDSKDDFFITGIANGKFFSGEFDKSVGVKQSWFALYDKPIEKEENKNSTPLNPILIKPIFAHGLIETPRQENYLIKNATVWTNEQEGILLNTDVLIEKGKIVKIGKEINATEAVVIDATNKILTCGIIDEHSHIAMSDDANEASHSVTSEVRIKDILDPEDMSIYYQLAGGTTTSQILHGSANPIGGQSVIIKHRWGVTPDELIVNDGAQFLKHALGENVKRSNVGFDYPTRYPQTRMGTEAIIRDAYMQALDYIRIWDRYNSLTTNEKFEIGRPRFDLRLEAIADVIRKKSFITCHAYVQSETMMIMRLAEDFGIKVHTLIHNTEGYKIADLIRQHGAFASNLPDWWAYKFEVYQAIPYNSAIQVRQGITVAIHSDNPELGRRLNQEAAKTMKYGGLEPEEAWKCVTLNPAKILHLDHRIGSIKVGKDADLVIWTDNPLSMYAKVEKTLVDGILYYDAEREQIALKNIKEERNRLINKILKENTK